MRALGCAAEETPEDHGPSNDHELVKVHLKDPLQTRVAYVVDSLFCRVAEQPG